jgi:hypothetical protein
MPAFQLGERVRTTQAIQDVLPDAALPERVRDLPLVGDIVALTAPGIWRVRFADLGSEIDLDEDLLMPMDAHPSLVPVREPNG